MTEQADGGHAQEQESWMDVLDVLAICAGNAIGVLVVQGIAALWHQYRGAVR